jgi:predicted aspartyl protease
MIRGRFGDTTTSPYVEASVHLPRLNIRGYVSFLVDTGASGSVLMPADSKKLGVRFNQLINPMTSHGIGGFSNGFNEDAVLAFSDGRYVYGFDVELEIAETTKDNKHLPSLLGRDVLNSCRVVADYRKRTLTFSPQTWDLRVKLRSK